MSEKKVSLDICDIESAATALQIATKRGAFELSEAGQIAPVVARLLDWTEGYRAAKSEIPTNSGQGESE